MNEFTEDKMKEFREVFELYDKNKDNYLDLEEADCAFKCLGYDFGKEEILQIFGEYGLSSKDEVTNSKITFDAFVNFLNKRNKEFDTEAELIDCFKSFDRDGDGKLDVKEMKYLLLTLGEQLKDEEIEEMINQVDTTGLGAITYKDFVKILLTK